MQRPKITYCERCANVYRLDRRDPPWRWMCIRHRRMEGFGFVTTGTWDDAPPYLYCRDVNGGQCPLYEPLEPEPTESAEEPTMEFAK
jgi:hypothetical protein